MFKKMQWKIVFIFVALVTAIMIIVGIYMIGSIIRLYDSDFNSQLDKVMSGEFTGAISGALSENVSDQKRTENVNAVISAYSQQLGLSEQRQCTVLNASDASRIATTDAGDLGLEKTPNIIQAMAGKTGKKTRLTADYMDYAYYLEDSGGTGGYIIYVKDNKQGMNTLIHNMLYIVLQALLFGVAASVFLGYFLSKTISSPISVLTEKAEDFAEGNFDSNLEVLSQDEIGTLVETFNYMGKVMKKAISDAAGEKHKLEIIIEHINNGIIAFNTSQEIISINSAAKRMLSITNPEEIVFDDFFAGLNANVCTAEFMYIEKYRPVMREIEVNNRHIMAYFVPFKMENDKTAGIVCVFEDVTQQFNLENSRKKFVAEVSHELKTPLTTIGAYTETLLDSGYETSPETTRSFLETIQSETIKMTNLVKNLLTLSRFDAQSIELKKEFFSLDALARDIASTFKIEAENKGLEIKFNLINDVPDVFADKFQIERAVKNIVSNAIKYTPKGGCVKIFAGCLYNEAYLKIEDNGIGIPEQDLPHIFDRFYRVDKARSREQGGTGLGLSIAREIVQNHGGSIGIESKYGEFTRVTIKLPLISA